MHYKIDTNAHGCTGPMNTAPWVQLIVLLGAAGVLLAGLLPLLMSTWNQADYSHGIIVPFISMYFVWLKRNDLKSLPLKPSLALGLPVMVAGAMMLMAGRISSVVVVEESSIIVIIAALVLMLLGLRHLKALALPIAYLILMVPALDPIIEQLQWPFQLFAARFSTIALKLIGIPVFRNVQYLELPNITLEVADECSGVHYLVSIIAIGIPLAYFTQRTLSRKAALVILAVLIGIMANVVRVTLIGIYAYTLNKTDVHGPMHVLKGVFVSVVGYVFLFAGAWVLNWIPSKSAAAPTAGSPASSPAAWDYDSKRFNVSWAVATASLLLLVMAFYFYTPSPVSIKKSLRGFPVTVSGMKGEDTGFFQAPLRDKGADSELMRVYRDESGSRVWLYMAYYESQDQDKELVHYDMRRLYYNSTEVPVTTPDGSTINVNEAEIRYGSQKYLVYFWYYINGRVVTDRFKAKIATTVDGLVRNRTNGAIILVFSQIDETSAAASPGPVLSGFAAEVAGKQARFFE